MRTVKFEQLRPKEICDEKERFSVVYLPIGPLEWHGPHLPVGMDPLNAEAVSRLVAENIGGVVLPTFYWGTEREREPEMYKSIGFKEDEWIIGMDFPANIMPSFYASEDTFGIAVREYLNLLVKQKYKLIVIVNGHGAENHISVLNRLAKEFTAETESTVLYVMAIINDENVEKDIGHATKLETSILKYLYPESLDLSLLPPRDEKLYNLDYAVVDGETFGGNPTSDFSVRHDPRDATIEIGRNSIGRAVKVISEMVIDKWQEINK